MICAFKMAGFDHLCTRACTVPFIEVSRQNSSHASDTMEWVSILSTLLQEDILQADTTGAMTQLLKRVHVSTQSLARDNYIGSNSGMTQCLMLLISSALLLLQQKKKHDFTEAECALRWMVHHSKLDTKNGDTVIIGASSPKHLEDNLRDFERGPLRKMLWLLWMKHGGRLRGSLTIITIDV